MKLSIKDITLIAMTVAIIEVCKITLSFLPNIELTTFWLIMFTIYYNRGCYLWNESVVDNVFSSMATISDYLLYV